MNVLELTVNTGNKTDVSKATGKAYLHDRSNSGKEAWANLTECLISDSGREVGLCLFALRRIWLLKLPTKNIDHTGKFFDAFSKCFLSCGLSEESMKNENGNQIEAVSRTKTDPSYEQSDNWRRNSDTVR